MKGPVKFPEEDLAQLSYDLCTTINGIYVDIIKCCDNTWRVCWDHRAVKEGCKTRDEAREWLDKAVETLSKGGTYYDWEVQS